MFGELLTAMVTPFDAHGQGALGFGNQIFLIFFFSFLCCCLFYYLCCC